MKHFVIMCAAVALAIPSTAFARMTATHSLPLNVEAGKTLVAPNALESDHLAKASLKAESTKKLTRDDLLGTYIQDDFSYSSNKVGWHSMWAFPEIVAGENPDEVIIEGFWTDYDTSYYPPVPISRVPAKFDYENQTLTMESGVYLGTYGDYPAYMYVSEWATDKLLDEPIVFKINPESREISYYCERINDDWNAPVKCLIITCYPDAIGEVHRDGVDFLGAVLMNKYNGIMYNSNVTSGESGYLPIYTEVGGNKFTIYNFGGYGFDCGLTFTADFQAGTATSPRTLLRENMALDENTVADIYFAGADGGEIVGTLSEPASGSYLRTLTIPKWCFLDGKTENVIYEFADAMVDVDFTPGSGVETAVVEPDGEPEYYTLDGLRVDNPAKGTIVVCRQGSKVSKIIVK